MTTIILNCHRTLSVVQNKILKINGPIVKTVVQQTICLPVTMQVLLVEAQNIKTHTKICNIFSPVEMVMSSPI